MLQVMIVLSLIGRPISVGPQAESMRGGRYSGLAAGANSEER